jgi:hypothetical protein
MPSARRASSRARLFFRRCRQFAKVLTVQSEDVEGVELDLVVVLPAVQAIEVGDAVHAEQYGFAIEDELLRSNATGRLNDQRITRGPVIAVTNEEPDSIGIARDDQRRPGLSSQWKYTLGRPSGNLTS